MADTAQQLGRLAGNSTWPPSFPAATTTATPACLACSIRYVTVSETWLVPREQFTTSMRLSTQ